MAKEKIFVIQMTKDLYTGKQLLKAIAKATQYKNEWLEYTLHRSCPDVQLAQEKKPNVREQNEPRRKQHCIAAE